MACALGLVAGLAGGVVASAAGHDSRHHQAIARSQPPSFRVYDNTQYVNVDLESLGLIRSGIVEETRPQAQAIAQGELPAEGPFDQAVAVQALNPGPLVLDYEDLYLQGAPATVAFHLRVLRALLGWAHQAAPAKVIGFYGLLDHTAAQYLNSARDLAAHEGAFFPSMYTRDADRGRWLQRLISDATLARRIAPTKPLCPYLWPQYDVGPSGGSFLSAADWSFELASAHSYADGVVIWSKRTTNLSEGWVGATASFMRGP